MRDINHEAEQSLSRLGCSVCYSHPKTFTSLPVVSFFNVSEKGAFYADNEESVQSGYVQVDVWAAEGAQCGFLALNVNEIMTGDGWTRQMSADIPEDNEKIYHKTMRFHKYFTV